ncbi:MAG: aminotransferase class I/II-fold pyridoxal phosphate-dependent enzyme [Paracoccaceae bacterium]
MRSSTRSNVDPFIVMDVMEAARRAEEGGRHIIHMEVGQPGTGASQHARDSLAAAMEQGSLGYTVALGIPELRARIARLYGEWYNIDLNPDRVVITPGSSGAFILAFNALFDSGARVGIGAPGYPSYRHILTALGLNAVTFQTSSENRFQPAVQDFEHLSLDGLMVASPANPTGTMLDEAALGQLIEAAHRQNISFISDEIYHGIEYEAKAVTALQVTDDTYVINSFSKYFSMTGWRVGWMVVPEDHVRVIERMAQNLFICAPHASQVASLAALDSDAELQSNMDVYRKNRALMIEGLSLAGFDNIAPPDGAFYVYADVSRITQDSRQFCADVLTHAGVAITPGLDFDPERGAQTVRFSYARSTDDIEEGLARLKEFMRSRGYV